MHLDAVRGILADPLGSGPLVALAEIGYGCIGVAHSGTAAEIRDLCRTARLRPMVMHIDHCDLVGDWAAKLADARTTGVRWLVYFELGWLYWACAAAVRQQRRRFPRAAREGLLRRRGL